MRESLAKLYDADILMQTAFKEIGSLSMDTILSQRKSKGKDVEKEMEKRELNRKMMQLLEKHESDDESDGEDDNYSDQSKESGYSTPVRRSNSDHFKDVKDLNTKEPKDGKGSSVKKELKKLGGLLKKGVTNAKNAIKNVRSLKEVKPQTTVNSPH